MFILDEARKNRCGVLVHCVAGVSRSVAVTVAYLMKLTKITLNEAYDFVRRRKQNISPNLNFLGQLLEMEQALGVTAGGSTCRACTRGPMVSMDSLEVCTCAPPSHPSPDSGVDFEHWS